MSDDLGTYPDESDFWKRVRNRLSREVVREVHAQRPPTLAQRVALVDELRGATSWGLWVDELVAWTRAQPDARGAARVLAELDFRLGAWCACQVARTTLTHVADGRHSLDEVERWVRGASTRQACWDATIPLNCRYHGVTPKRLKNQDFRVFFTATAAASYCGQAVGGAPRFSEDRIWHAAHNALAMRSALSGSQDTCSPVWSPEIKAIAHSLVPNLADAIVTMPWVIGEESPGDCLKAREGGAG